MLFHPLCHQASWKLATLRVRLPSPPSTPRSLPHRVLLLEPLSSEGTAYLLRVEPSEWFSVFSYLTPSPQFSESPSPSDPPPFPHHVFVLRSLSPGRIQLPQGYLPVPRSRFRLVIPTRFPLITNLDRLATHHGIKPKL